MEGHCPEAAAYCVADLLACVMFDCCRMLLLCWQQSTLKVLMWCMKAWVALSEPQSCSTWHPMHESCRWDRMATGLDTEVWLAPLTSTPSSGVHRHAGCSGSMQARLC
jgi:hypothetical protein